MIATRGGVVTGWGIAVPDKVVTNDDLSVIMDTSDEWITERTGIRERRIGGTTSQLAIDAGVAALERAGRRPDEIDGVILATTTPDQIVPGTSASVQDGIGVPSGAFDVNAACSGFVYALTVAHGLLAIGAERLLVIGSETLSRITACRGTSAPTARSATSSSATTVATSTWTARRSSAKRCGWSSSRRSRRSPRPA
jgi:3-oxoacyl-[acyl-carrier-protein] synthase III